MTPRLAAGSRRRLRALATLGTCSPGVGEPIAFSRCAGEDVRPRPPRTPTRGGHSGPPLAAGQVAAPPQERTAHEDLDTPMVAGSRRRHGGRGLGGGRHGGVGRGGRHHRQTRRPGPVIGPAAPDPPDRGKRDRRQPQQGDGAAAAVPGDGVRGHAARREGLVRAAGRLRPRPGARPGRELRAQAGQHRDRRPGRGADRDADQPVTPAEPVRPGRGELRRRAELQPDPDRGPRADRVPAGQVRARRRGGPGYSPFIRSPAPTSSTTRRSSRSATARST